SKTFTLTTYRTYMMPAGTGVSPVPQYFGASRPGWDYYMGVVWVYEFILNHPLAPSLKRRGKSLRSMA
ncbi:MAG: hypothetical protein WD625_04050, partial [Balneolales bacterium]